MCANGMGILSAEHRQEHSKARSIFTLGHLTLPRPRIERAPSVAVLRNNLRLCVGSSP